MHVFNDICESGYYRTNRTYHYRDLDTQPVLNRLVAAGLPRRAQHEGRPARGRPQGNALVEFGQRCFQPRWKKQ